MQCASHGSTTWANTQRYAMRAHARTVHLTLTQTQTLRYSVSMLFCFTVKAKAFCIFTQKIQSSRFRDVEQVLISVALVLDCTRVSIPDLSSAFWCVCSCLVTCSLWLMHSFGRSFVSSFQSGVPSTKRRAKNHRRCSAHRNTA